MLYAATMIFRQHEQEKERCWHRQERQFVVPMSGKRIMTGKAEESLTRILS
ncbi:MAG: hypothetical protein IJ773_13550 [Lachnospiraceae bacterium]|nr:hypothetical protein [Lachnospiraceae bacterium]